jgi:hypothetical protein
VREWIAAPRPGRAGRVALECLGEGPRPTERTVDSRVVRDLKVGEQGQEVHVATASNGRLDHRGTVVPTDQRRRRADGLHGHVDADRFHGSAGHCSLRSLVCFAVFNRAKLV